MNQKHPDSHDTVVASIEYRESGARWRELLARAGVGGVLAGAYRLMRPLGEGAMGMVVLATDQRLNRLVAIKLVHSEMLEYEGMKERFIAEARTMARIDDPNVMKVFDFGEIEGIPYFVMEYVDGPSLQELLFRQTTRLLAVDEVLRLLRQIASGAEAIHRAGAVHRDLKPGNVLLAPGNRAVITDLGLARSLDSIAGGIEVVGGTPAYMPPEVGKGEEATPQTDVYALGVIAFEMLTGRLPFYDARTSEMVRQHVTEAPPHPCEVRPSLPRPLGNAVLTALAKDPLARPATPTAFAGALSAARSNCALDEQVRIYVVDDDPDMRRLVSVVLREGYPDAEVALFENGAQALAALRQRPPTLAIVDFQMPIIAGGELLRELRASEQAASTPVIIMTAVGGAQDWQKLRALGANAFLAKPFDPSALLSAVDRLMGAQSRKP